MSGSSSPVRDRAVRDRPTPPPLRWERVTVAAIHPITPRMIRVTVTGPGLHDFATAGPDQHLKLILPRGTAPLRVPDPTRSALQQWRELPDDVRPFLRTYTVRAARPAQRELDVDVALHDVDTVTMRWIRRVRPGDGLALFGVRGEFDPPPGTDRLLLIADETGVPALAAILEAHPEMPADAIAEVEDAGDIVPLGLPPHQRIVWVTRDGRRSPGDPAGLLAALADGARPAGELYAWAAGETGAVAALRARLAGIPFEAVGYWRIGSATDPD
jgi:NADPH-dependent ferric siderophore reductase